MNEDYKIKVLWVDDEPNDDFMNEAYEEGLDLDNVICVEDGIASLKDPSKSYDAIILDGNCRIKHDMNEQPSLHALRNAITQLLEMQTDIPWFVYTAANYEGKEALEYMISERKYDDRPFYVKSAGRYEMYKNIKKAVATMPTAIVKKKYASVLKVYSSHDFIRLLTGFEEGSIAEDTSVPNTIRKILEWIMGGLNQKGALPVSFNGTNLGECSVCIGMMRDFIPSYIQRSFQQCVELSNEGSHNKNSETNRLIEEGKAPYLNISLVADLLNILHWYGTIPDDVLMLRKCSIESYTSNKAITLYGKVTKAPSGYLELGHINISVAYNKLKEGDFVAYNKNAKKYIKLAYYE